MNLRIEEVNEYKYLTLGDLLRLKFTFMSRPITLLVTYRNSSGNFYLQGLDGETSYYHRRGFGTIRELRDHIQLKSDSVEWVEVYPWKEYELKLVRSQ